MISEPAFARRAPARQAASLYDDGVQIDRVLAEVDRAREEITDLAARLVRIPTINPPGDEYETCAALIGDQLRAHGADVQLLPAVGRLEHTPEHPRINVVGRQGGSAQGPAIHLNGHFDVVPVGLGWTRDPFGGEIADGKLYGRGSCDMKAGIAAAVFAAEAIRRSGVGHTLPIEVSGTVDEESGGFAGVAWLAENRWLSRERTRAVIIPEPFGVDRVCIGHRGVYWFEVITEGRIAHGSMPYLGVNAIEGMSHFLDLVRDELGPALAQRMTAMPVVPEGSRYATININGIDGGQPVDEIPSPCVADRCRAVFDRRFLLEEGLDQTRGEIAALVQKAQSRMPSVKFSIEDRLIFEPTRAPEDAPLIGALTDAIAQVTGRKASLVASPGTYDQKHVARIAGVPHCVAYGPGELAMAHQPDEYCSIDDIVSCTKVLALAVLRLANL
ncbi:MAG: acetylornithine deacetylase/succinyl-diaminopimelate desuccinylase family protein [Cyanobacteria bacterium]|nr:acetylornithine deacetylase/succinyl-diaminopimelate desuccinylase family protein [Cyanobacteriota bacterium]